MDPILKVNVLFADTICRNWDILCNTWEDMGECEANPKWMKRHCARACKQCDGEDAPGNPAVSVYSSGNVH